MLDVPFRSRPSLQKTIWAIWSAVYIILRTLGAECIYVHSSSYAVQLVHLFPGLCSPSPCTASVPHPHNVQTVKELTPDCKRRRQYIRLTARVDRTRYLSSACTNHMLSLSAVSSCSFSRRERHRCLVLPERTCRGGWPRQRCKRAPGNLCKPRCGTGETRSAARVIPASFPMLLFWSQSASWRLPLADASAR